MLLSSYETEKNLYDEVDNLYSTDDWESSEESHGTSDETQLGLSLDLLVSLNVVECGCVKVDLY